MNERTNESKQSKLLGESTCSTSCEFHDLAVKMYTAVLSSYEFLLSCSVVYYAVQGGSKLCVCG